MSTQRLNADQLLTGWLSDYVKTLPAQRGILRIRCAEPRFQTRNFFSRFKIDTAKFDGTGQNPTAINCLVLEISETDQTATVVTTIPCDSIKDAY
jgi:hypothetical protein